jgi:hypothetical protein
MEALAAWQKSGDERLFKKRFPEKPVIAPEQANSNAAVQQIRATT